MTTARRQLIDADSTPYYHCISRCVRRAFLCGVDDISGNCYEHRRGWIEDKLFELQQIFAIDIAAYSIMSNHFHLILHIDKQQALAWSIDEVLDRWLKLFKGSALIQRYRRGDKLSEAEAAMLSAVAEEYRERLMSISWWMRLLNESIARKANAEDNCKGHFWESRFKSQALLDEAALLSCMTYVDLNPIRTKLAKTPETSDFTSVKARIQQVLKGRKTNKSLLPFIGNEHINQAKGIAFSLEDYLTLVDQTGRVIREDKRGFIDNQCASILNRLGLDEETWLANTQHFHTRFKCVAGNQAAMQQAAEHFDKRWFQTPLLRSST